MSRTMSRFALSLFTVTLLVAPLASCGSDLLRLDQRWTLLTVRDSILPYSVPRGAHDVIINSATADLHSDNTYTITYTGSTDGVAGQAGSDQGHWSITSSIFTFQSATFRTDYIAALVGSTFRVTVPGQMLGSSEPSFDMVFSRTP